MTLLITTNVAGQIDVNPRRVKIITSATYAQVTTAGFLNSAAKQGDTIYPTDLFDVVYSYSKTSGSGTYQEFTCTIVAGLITLVPSVDLGNIVLPVVSGNVPSFDGTTGLMQDSGILASNIALLSPSGHTQSIAGSVFLNSNPVVVTNFVTVTHTQLASAGKVNIFTAPTATAQILLLDWKVLKSTGLSGGSGDRLLSIADGTLVFNTTGITAAILGTPVFTLLGASGNPIPSSSEVTVSTAGANVYVQYVGGTTDYSAGQVSLAISYAQITT